MSNSSYIDIIRDAIYKAQGDNIKRTQLFSDNTIVGKHEFLFFIKPEITMPSATIKLDAVLTLILDKIDEFGLKIKNSILLPASYLEEYNIIAQHYGVINAIARNAKKNLSTSAIKCFEEQFNIKLSDAPIYGGLELLEKYPSFTPETLNYLWQNSPTFKLGGGAYAQALKFDGELVYLVNGFHPMQLDHFIQKGRSIVAFTLVGDLSWEKARNLFIGKTNPEDAAEGSIRQTLLENRGDFGLQSVSSSWNGVHLSAGPVEGLVELMRYNSDFDKEEKLAPEDFSFGVSLQNLLGESMLKKTLNNELVDFHGKKESIFDLTEEKNADEALKILTEINIK